MANRRDVNLIIGAILGTVSFLILSGLTYTMGMGDSDIYLSMGKDPFSEHISPWGYRIGIPMIVYFLSKLLNVDAEMMFFLLQLIFYVSIVTILFCYSASKFELDRPSSLIICLFFIFSYIGTYNIHNFMHIGYAEYLLILVGFIAILEDRFYLLLLVIVISSFVKENIGLLLIPTYVVRALLRLGFKKVVPRCAILIVLFGAIFVLLRHIDILHVGLGSNHYLSFYDLHNFKATSLYYSSIFQLLLHTFLTFGLLWFLVFDTFIHGSDILAPSLTLIILSIIQIILATDTLRMVSCSFPAVLMLSAVTISRKSPHIRWGAIYINTVLYLCFNHRLNVLPLVYLIVALGLYGLYRSYMSRSTRSITA